MQIKFTTQLFTFAFLALVMCLWYSSTAFAGLARLQSNDSLSCNSDLR